MRTDARTGPCHYSLYNMHVLSIGCGVGFAKAIISQDSVTRLLRDLIAFFYKLPFVGPEKISI